MVFAGAAALGLWGMTAGGGAPTEAPKEPERVSAALIPLDGEINETLHVSAMRRANEAIADGCKILIFGISSYGGELTPGLDLSRDINGLPERGVRTVAFVDSKAISAAALAAMSCQEIVMTPRASIGDCQPIIVSPEGVKPAGEKFETVLRQQMGDLCEEHGISRAIGKAMVSLDITVIKIVNKKTHDVRYIEENDLAGLPDAANWEKKGVLDGPDTLLTVGGKQANEIGLARHLVSKFDDLYDLYPIAGRIREYPVTWTETLVLWLNNMVLKALLVLVGLIGIYVEMTTPGFGVPGTIALVAFGLVFLSSFLAGRPNWLPVIMFAVGATLLAIELFVTPGFGVMGTAGILLLLGSIILALPSFSGLPRRPFEYDELMAALGMTAVVLAVFVISVAVLARFLPRVPVLGKLVLASSIVSDGSSRAAAARVEAAARVGQVGRSATKLRPAGKVMFGERLVDVMAEGDFIDAGLAVEVVEVRGNRILVVPKEADGGGPKA